MKKIVFPLALLILSLSILAGCGNNPPQAPASDPPSTQDEAQTPSLEQEQAQAFQPGTWFSESPVTASYYFFDADGTSGRTASLQTGTGVGFTYTVDGENIVFSMGSADATEKGTLSMTDDTHATITWDDGQEEYLTFVSAQGSDTFQFFSNEELCAMAIAYYTNTTGESAPQAAADMGAETVTIQLYNNLGDHNSTCAWYQVSRLTGKGTDVNSGQEIDLVGDEKASEIGT